MGTRRGSFVGRKFRRQAVLRRGCCVVETHPPRRGIDWLPVVLAALFVVVGVGVGVLVATAWAYWRGSV